MSACKKCGGPTAEGSGICLNCQAEATGDFSRTAEKKVAAYTEYKEECPVCGYQKFKGMDCHKCFGLVKSHAPGEGVESGRASINVTVTDIDMPFFSMVGFMVKFALATIPAITILLVLFFIVSAVFRGAF